MPTYEYSDRLLEAIRQMASFSVVDDVMPAILQRVAVLANDTIDSSHMVGLTMAVKGRPETPVFTDEASPEIDSAQYESGVGPCLQAFRDGHVYAVPSTAEDTRWKAFSEACLHHGIHSTLSVPVLAKDKTFGALNFYSKTEKAFGDDEETLAVAFAAHAAIVIANADAYWSARALADQLSAALESRVVIEQSKGILMATGVTSTGAFDILRKASQRQNRKLHLVAGDIVAEAERRAASV